MRIITDLSNNFSKKRQKIKYIVIHYTGMQSTIESLKWLKNRKSKVSSHYLINRDGVIFQLVLDRNTAWHAGNSRWKNDKNLNSKSIGIELQNKGQRYGYQNFPIKKILILEKLIKKLKKKYKIKNRNILGHSDIAPLRKIDPGEKFPWYRFDKINFNLRSYGKKNIFNKEKNNQRKVFFLNIYKIGYRFFNISKKSKSDKKIIKAFQMRYLPRNVSGKIDNKTLKISHFLASKS